MTPDEYCQHKAAQSGSSFYYSFLFLPAPKRRAITALYAFCREVDDIVDECSDTALAHTKLAWWRGEIHDLFSGQPHHPVAQALLPVIQNHAMQVSRFYDIIDGMQMDLTQNRYPDFDALKLYCRRVAGVVGELAATIFEFKDPATLHYANALGLAFQLTNIIRDVGEDARMNRIYLPLDEIRRFGVTENDLLEARHSVNFQRLMEFQIERAEQHYALAFSLLPAIDRKTQCTGLIMAAIYQMLLKEIKLDSCRVLTQRTSLTPLRKLWLAWRTWVTT